MNKSFTETWSENIRNSWKNFLSWLDEHDAAGWPAFGVFFGVITVAMIFNYLGFEPKFGPAAAIGISLMFESAVLAWKMTSNRKRNDARQNQLAGWATWLSIALAITMLVVNLFRVGGDTWFNPIAYGVVGAAAVVQVIFYVWYDNSNPDKVLDREHNQNKRGITRKERRANFAIADLNEDLKIIRFIANELMKMKREFADLDPSILEPMLEQTRQKLLKEYATGKSKNEIDDATKGMADVNNDGLIGRPAPTQRRVPQIANHTNELPISEPAEEEKGF